VNPYAAALAVVTSELDNAIRRVQEHEHDLTEITTAEAARGVATALVDCRAEVARLRAIAAAPLVALLHSGDVQPGSCAVLLTDGRELAERVMRELARLGVAPVAIHRRGRRLVEVELPAAWPAHPWSVADVLPGAMGWTVCAHQDGSRLLVRRRP